jgi:hypothetical protein
MNTFSMKGLILAAALTASSLVSAGQSPTAATVAPSGSIVSNNAVVSQLIAIRGTRQPPSVVRDIGKQIAAQGGTYNQSTGAVRALIDAGPDGIFLLTIEDGKLSFVPVAG